MRPEELLLCPCLPTAEALNNNCTVARDEQVGNAPVRPLRQGRHIQQLDRNAPNSFIPLATLNKRISMKNSIAPDPFASEFLRNDKYKHHHLLSDYAPCVISDEAYMNDLLKYDREVTGVPDDFFEIVLSGMRGLQEDEQPDEDGSEALRGVAPFLEEEIELWDASRLRDSIDGSKSSGSRLPMPKGHYVGRKAMDETQFKKAVSEAQSRLEVDHGDYVPGVWMACPKAELRDLERVQQGKTRVFMAPSIDEQLGIGTVSGPFNERFIENHCKNGFPSTLGINKFSRGWHDKIACNLFTCHDPSEMVYISGDGSRYDSSVNPALMSLNLYYRVMSLPSGNPKRWRRLVRRLQNYYKGILYTPLLTILGVIFRKSTGNPSGSPTTADDNTLVLIAVVFYALVRIFGSVRKVLRLLLSGKIRYLCNGDDLVMAVHKSIQDAFTNEQLSAVMKECGLSYDFTPRTNDIERVSYLGHSFVKVPDLDGKEEVYIPKLDPKRISASLVWTKDKELNAIKRHSRYVAAQIAAWPSLNMFKTCTAIVLASEHEAGADTDFADSSYCKKFPLFTHEDIRRLYLEPKQSNLSSIVFDDCQEGTVGYYLECSATGVEEDYIVEVDDTSEPNVPLAMGCAKARKTSTTGGFSTPPQEEKKSASHKSTRSLQRLQRNLQRHYQSASTEQSYERFALSKPTKAETTTDQTSNMSNNIEPLPEHPEQKNTLLSKLSSRASMWPYADARTILGYKRKRSDGLQNLEAVTENAGASEAVKSTPDRLDERHTEEQKNGRRQMPKLFELLHEESVREQHVSFERMSNPTELDDQYKEESQDNNPFELLSAAALTRALTSTWNVGDMHTQQNLEDPDDDQDDESQGSYPSGCSCRRCQGVPVHEDDPNGTDTQQEPPSTLMTSPQEVEDGDEESVYDTASSASSCHCSECELEREKIGRTLLWKDDQDKAHLFIIEVNPDKQKSDPEALVRIVIEIGDSKRRNCLLRASRIASKARELLREISKGPEEPEKPEESEDLDELVRTPKTEEVEGDNETAASLAELFGDDASVPLLSRPSP